MILSCSKINKSYGTDVILDQINFHINEKEKVAIVGINGAGKSTLIKIIAGKLEADAGKVHLRANTRISYLAQNDALDSSNNIYEEILNTRKDIVELETSLSEMEFSINHHTGSLEDLEALNHDYTALRLRFEQLDGYAYKSYVRGVLFGLGFNEDEFNTPIAILSGGQQTRLALAKLLISKPDILLLDEPTNHLDIKATEWLETYLSNYDGALLIISHDRYFLDKVVSKVIEIEHHNAHIYNGNYSFYVQNKEQRQTEAIKKYQQQQKEIKRQEAVIKELRSFKRDKFITRAKSREKSLDKMEILDKPQHLNDAMHIRLDPKYVSGNDVLAVEGLSKSFGDLTLFNDINFNIYKGEKVALIGPNGVGKSTLFKILLEQLTGDKGSFKFGAKVYTGYYDQSQDQHHDDLTLVQDMQTFNPKLSEGEIRNILAAFLFTGDDVFKLVASLSGGERGRLSLAKLMVSRSNFLMLDEPTNHLDMVSKSILENALNQYTGTVFFISHDRYFINQVATKVLELKPDGLWIYDGNYDYYLNEREKQSSKDTAIEDKKVSDNKSKWLENKAKATEEKKKQKTLEKLEADIEGIERRMDAIDEALCDVAIYTDHIKATELSDEKATLESQLEALYEQWEALS